MKNDFLARIKRLTPFVHAATVRQSYDKSIYDKSIESVCLKRKQQASFVVPFNYSKLALGLSVCILSQALLAPYAYASSDEVDSVEDSELLKDEQLEEALIALKLKQAVEQGLIDSSVLEDYKRETLTKETQSSTQTTAGQTANSQTVNSQTTNNSPVNTTNSTSVSNPDPAKVATSTSAECNPELEMCDTDDSFENAFVKADKDAPNIAMSDNTTLQTPAQIDALLNQVDNDVPANFQSPVARLNTAEPPIGLDQNIKSLDLTNPTDYQNTQSQDIQSQNTVKTESQRSAITSEGSIGYVSPDEDLTNANNSRSVDDADITGEMLVEAQEQGAAPIINPDDYLPEYEVESDADAKETALIASDKDSISATNDVGFFERIYARLFNDGYTSLPKLKANIYLQDESRTNSDGKPLLIEADDDVQPANNIKAAMENITVEAITDFTAALPKLRDEALMAATAVGYYDVNLKFTRENNNTINVIIEQLGEPVKVAHRLVDVRGEGTDLAEFTNIEENAKPLEGDVFNHGAYKNIKASIEEIQDRLGFFDATWLNKSVDVLLPDNTADIDLIYDTGTRYRFDDVVFFTLDEETGKLTTDPDKLPLKPELLHQLYNFESGDVFYRPKITSFTNDLSATNYFNLVNVEVVRPAAGFESESILGFSNETNRVAKDRNDVIDDDITMTDVADTTSAPNDRTMTIEAGSRRSVSEIDSDSNTDEAEANVNDTATTDAGVLESNELSDSQDYEPIEFRVDEVTSNKLDAITAKAERLITLPDNRVLDEESEKSKNLLGKISDAISNAVAKILPEEDDDLLVNNDSAEDYEPEVLEGRKTPQEVAETKAVPLYVFVMADKPKDADIGIGYGTDTGFRFVGRLEHNLLNRDGYQAGITVGASELDKSFEVHVSRPWKHPLNDKLYANLSYEQEEKSLGDNRPDISINTIKGGVARNIRKESGWNRTYSLRYRLDQVDSDVSGPARDRLPYPFNVRSAKFNQQSLLLGYAMDKTITDNVTNPTSGWRQYYSIEGGADNVLTDTNMAIVRAGVSGIHSFGEFNRHQVLGKFDAGYIWANDFKNVPFQQRFYAGGDRSIRGYDYNSLSAIDDNGNLIGGEILALGSAEYNYEFKPGFRGAVFADAGNAYDESFDVETKLGVGFGIRWTSPVGMVRLDLAAGVLEDSIPIRLHFFIGSPLQ